MRRRALVLAALATLAPATAAGQADHRAACADVLAELFAAEGLGTPCLVLAGNLVLHLTDGLYLSDEVARAAVSPRDLQPAQSGSADAAGSPAQSEAVPTVQPQAIGGGSVSAVGSGSGADAITALTFNPSIFFRADHAGEALARSSRLTDLTVYFPLDELDRDGDGDIDYFGMRLRVNVAGWGAGEEVWESAERLLRGLVADETDAARRLGALFLAMPAGRIAACARRIRDGSARPGEVVEACGDDILPTFDRDGYRAFRAAMRAVRERADSRYFGLDLRLDLGDPTLGAVRFADATALTGGLAFGTQLVPDDPAAASVGLRARAGVRYVDLHRRDRTDFAFDGGLGFVARKPLDALSELTLSGGFEARFGGVEDRLEAALQSDYLVFRAALSVPLTGSTAVTLAFSHPLAGDDMSQTLSITGDWRLLLPDLGPDF